MTLSPFFTVFLYIGAPLTNVQWSDAVAAADWHFAIIGIFFKREYLSKSYFTAQLPGFYVWFNSTLCFARITLVASWSLVWWKYRCNWSKSCAQFSPEWKFLIFLSRSDNLIRLGQHNFPFIFIFLYGTQVKLFVSCFPCHYSVFLADNSRNPIK